MEMANAIGMIGGFSCSATTNNSTKKKNRNQRVEFCFVSAFATGINDPYMTLKIHPNASKSEVKKAFRKLALQYHPDVCRGNNNGIQFHHINEAYDVVMSKLRQESRKQEMESCEPYDASTEEAAMELNDPDCELWEEWMGWEGAGIRNYSSHVNPYI